MAAQTPETTAEIVADVLASLASGGPEAPEHPHQWLVDMGYRHVVVTTTNGTGPEALAVFDALDFADAEAEMERLGASGRYTDRFGVNLAIGARK